MKTDELYQRVTDMVIAQLEAGTDEWRKPWIDMGTNLFPVSASTGKPYAGVNVLILACTGAEKGYRSEQWGTFQTWFNKGDVTMGPDGFNVSTVHVRKGEKATHVFLLKQGVPPTKAALARNPEAKPFTMMKAYAVFNRDQVDGLEPLPEPALTEHQRLAEAERYFAEIGADFREDGDRAYYSSATDHIVVPALGQFADPEAYYSTIAHEHVHWTGAKHRLERTFGARFGDEAYAAEELVAELGAAFWCMQMGVTPTPRPDHAQYLSHWLKVLRADSKAIVTASSAASKALGFLNEAANWSPQRILEVV